MTTTYIVPTMTKEAYYNYMMGDMDYRIKNLEVVAETEDAAIEKARAEHPDWVIYAGGLETLEQKQAREAREKAYREYKAREAQEEKARKQAEQLEARAAKAGMTVTEYKEYKKTHDKEVRLKREIKQMEQQIEQMINELARKRQKLNEVRKEG